MTQLTPSSSRKRPSPNDEAITSVPSTPNTISPPAKRRCRSPRTGPTPSLRLLIPGKDMPSTPPQSVVGVDAIALKLVIPQEQISHEQQRRLDRHKRDAERWKPKLQRPYPKEHETKKAYPLKLMRHYPNKNGRVQPDITIPEINKSLRVSRLLREFPLWEAMKRVDTPVDHSHEPVTPLSQATPFNDRRRHLKQARRENFELKYNKVVTRSEYARRLAWEFFSLPEADGWREPMILSPLDYNDLVLEAAGQPNNLPEWGKYRTGRFIAGQQNGLPN